MGVTKLVYGGVTKFDISDTTATADKVSSGYTFYDNDGVKQTGTAELVNVHVGQYAAASTTVLMSSLGYTADEYTQWTVDNFSVKTSNKSSNTGKKTITTNTYNALSMSISYVAPSLTYDPTTGTLTIVSASYSGSCYAYGSTTRGTSISTTYIDTDVYLTYIGEAAS